jgi:hypothetical protein
MTWKLERQLEKIRPFPSRRGRADSLTPAERDMLLYLARVADDGGDNIFISTSRLMEMTGRSERTVRYRMHALLGKQLIVRKQGGNGRGHRSELKIDLDRYHYFLMKSLEPDPEPELEELPPAPPPEDAVARALWWDEQRRRGVAALQRMTGRA